MSHLCQRNRTVRTSYSFSTLVRIGISASVVLAASVSDVSANDSGGRSSGTWRHRSACLFS